LKGCSCAWGWTQISTWAENRIVGEARQLYIRCVNPCHAGQYAMLQPRSQALAGCSPCPVDSYSAEGGNQVYDPARPLSQQCTRCPPGKGTAGMTGASSVENCTCASGISSTTTCGGCAANQYLDSTLTPMACVQCPLKMSSVANSVGIQSCLCPVGHERQLMGLEGCALCRAGYYSNVCSLLCKACPKGYTTATEGATSLTACKPLLLPLSN